MLLSMALRVRGDGIVGLFRRFPLRSPCDRLGQMLRRLRPADREFAAEDEHRHALNASLLRRLHFLLDLSDILVAGEIGAHLRGIEPDIGRCLHQHIRVRQVRAFGEI